MPIPCERNIPESRRGTGECDIRFDMLKRNGKPAWWCFRHGMEAAAPDGAPLPSCPGRWFEPVPLERQLDVDLADGEYAFWGVLPPALQLGRPPMDPGKVHIHRRAAANETKDIDGSYDLVRVRHEGRSLLIEGMAAVAFSISELADQPVVALRCPRCGEPHIDERRFATNPHRRHLCNRCGHPFHDTSGTSISNPLADAYDVLGLARPPAASPIDRPIKLQRADYDAVALWPSNCAIVSTMSRPEETGIHVHAWSSDGNLVVDDTYSPVFLDGGLVDERNLRWLALQVSLAHGAPIISKSCDSCGTPLVSPADGWVEPRTTHTCSSCGATTKTRRRVFFNPLAERQP